MLYGELQEGEACDGYFDSTGAQDDFLVSRKMSNFAEVSVEAL